MGSALKAAERAAAAEIIQPLLCSDAMSAPVWSVVVMLAVIRDMAKAGVDPARAGVRFEVDIVRDKKFNPPERTHLRMGMIGHHAAPVATMVLWDNGTSPWSASDNVLLRNAIERHLDVERILREGGDPLVHSATTTLCDPVAAAVLDGRANGLLASFPTDRAFTTRPAWSRRGIKPMNVAGETGITGTLTPGRLRVRRLEVAPGVHYDPPQGARDNGILTVRNSHWPDQLRRALPGRPLSEILGIEGLPEGHVVNSIRNQNAHTVVTVGGDHAFVPMR